MCCMIIAMLCDLLAPVVGVICCRVLYDYCYGV